MALGEAVDGEMVGTGVEVGAKEGEAWEAEALGMAEVGLVAEGMGRVVGVAQEDSQG